MCGIAGVFSIRDGRADASLMSERLRHRGPDDEGLATLRDPDGGCAGTFAHRRLSIIDLSAGGHQPKYSADRRLCLIFNGEIYNYRSLRAELEARGAVFGTASDTEVILEGWLRHGPAFLERLRGMFAFALWDALRGEGYLVRDAFGIKPLYVCQAGGEVLFASEVRPIVATGRTTGRLSDEAIRSYLATGSVAEPHTIFDGVVAVPAGSIVRVTPGAGGFSALPPESFTSIWPSPDETDRLSPTGSAQVRAALRDSVALHLVSDVPVALFLSGGLDSAAIAAVASEVSATRLDSYTVVFPEREFDEATEARATALHLGTHHTEVPVTSRGLLDALEPAFEAMDQPSLDGLNTFVISSAVRSAGFKVVLSGLGGDELFAGYPSFARARRAAPAWSLPPAARKLAAALAGSLPSLSARRIEALLEGPTPAWGAYSASRTLFDRRQTAELLAGQRRGRPAVRAPDSAIERYSLLQQVSMLEVAGYMRNTLLRDSDVFSMAHSLELRVPFLDIGVARAAFLAPDSAKLARGQSKPLLSAALQDRLPGGIGSRRKRGFTLPFERWMRSELRSEVDRVLGGGAASSIGLELRAVDHVWRGFLAGAHGLTWSRPWALYTLLRWAMRNGVAGGAVDPAPDREDAVLAPG